MWHRRGSGPGAAGLRTAGSRSWRPPDSTWLSRRKINKEPVVGSRGPAGDAPVVAVRVEQPEVTQPPRPVGKVFGQGPSGSGHACIVLVEVIDLEHQLCEICPGVVVT